MTQQMREIRIGRPTITPEGRRMMENALNDGRISEGLYTSQLELGFQKKLGVRHAIVVNSGHSALVVAYCAAKALRGIEKIVTTSMTFISTVSAALEAGLQVVCLDIGDDLQIDNDRLRRYFETDPSGSEVAYVPVHLFGYPCTPMHKIRGPHGVFQIDDACEAFGSRRAGGALIGTEGDIGCFSFYTSHVLGSGEMGLVVTNDDELAAYMRRSKDQGRTHLRPTNHIEKMTSIDPGCRYHHSILGWNFRTTDIQAALVLGALPDLGAILMRRRGVVHQLNNVLEKWTWAQSERWPHARHRLSLPRWDRDVSYLGYPIICGNVETRNLLMFGLDRRGVETRPLMSFLPEEEALANQPGFTAWECPMAKDLHSRGLYISCHDSLAEEDIDYVGRAFDEVLGQHGP